METNLAMGRLDANLGRITDLSFGEWEDEEDHNQRVLYLRSFFKTDLQWLKQQLGPHLVKTDQSIQKSGQNVIF